MTKRFTEAIESSVKNKLAVNMTFFKNYSFFVESISG